MQEDPEKNPKLTVGIRQTSKGDWYVGSLRIDGDNIEEIDTLINNSMKILNKRIEKLNNKEFEDKDIIKSEDKKPIILDPEEEKLFNELKELRRKIADKEGYPHYIIFHDMVLKRFAKLKPRTEEEMKKIEGVGEKNFEKYGMSFLSVIKSAFDVKIKW